MSDGQTELVDIYTPCDNESNNIDQSEAIGRKLVPYFTDI